MMCVEHKAAKLNDEKLETGYVTIYTITIGERGGYEKKKPIQNKR